jgi:hypothetical protein
MIRETSKRRPWPDPACSAIGEKSPQQKDVVPWGKYRVFLNRRSSFHCIQLHNYIVNINVFGVFEPNNFGRILCFWWQCHDATAMFPYRIQMQEALLDWQSPNTGSHFQKDPVQYLCHFSHPLSNACIHSITMLFPMCKCNLRSIPENLRGVIALVISVHIIFIIPHIIQVLLTARSANHSTVTRGSQDEKGMGEIY